MKGAIWCDMNSVAPQTKAVASKVVEQNGGRHVDVAVLAPVHPAHMAVPLLLSGTATHAARAELAPCGFTNKPVGGNEVGKASATKMIRSGMVKGNRALNRQEGRGGGREGGSQCRHGRSRDRKTK